jgi:hypothetical protein
MPSLVAMKTPAEMAGGESPIQTRLWAAQIFTPDQLEPDSELGLAEETIVFRTNLAAMFHTPLKVASKTSRRLVISCFRFGRSRMAFLVMK